MNNQTSNVIGIVIILLITMFLVPSININIVVGGILELNEDTLKSKIVNTVITTATDVSDALYLFKGYTVDQFKEEISREIINYEKEHGFIKSYKVQTLKSENYKLVGKLGFWDGIKNGFLVIGKPILGVFQVIIVSAKYIMSGESSKIIELLLFSFQSTFTRLGVLLITRASVLYYFGFFAGIGLGSGIFGLNNSNN